MTKKAFTIGKLAPDRWQEFQRIRLLALKTDPHAFCAAYADDARLTEQDWRSRLDVMLFALAGEQAIGLVGLLPNNNDKGSGHVVSLWVDPSFRGQGIGESLIKKVQIVAVASNIVKLSLEVTVTQKAALQLYEKMGFKKICLLKDNLLKNGHFLDEFLMEWTAK